MAGTLGYLRGATKCLFCHREHEPASSSSGIYGFASICPGHPVTLKRPFLKRLQFDGESTRTIADGLAGRHSA